MKLPTLEEMQMERLLTTHKAGPLVGFKYPKKVWGKGWEWNETTLEARGITYDTRTGDCICRPFKKFFNAHESECTANLAESSLTVKLDGTCVVSYLFEDQICCKTLGSFANEHTTLALPLVQEALGRYGSNSHDLLQHTTLIFELLSNLEESGVKSGSNVIDHIGPAKIVLLNARQIISGRLSDRKTLETLARQLGVELVEEITDLDAFTALRKSQSVWDGIYEGWAGIDDKGVMFKIKYADYSKLHHRMRKVGQWQYQKGRHPKSKVYQNAVDFLLNHPQYIERVYPNLDDILGALNTVMAELDMELTIFALEAKPYWSTLSRKEKKKRLKTIPKDLHEIVFRDNTTYDRKRALLLQEAAYKLDNPRKE